MATSQSMWIRFFGVPFRLRTYLNLLYLLLAFPLGVFYFCFFVIGVSFGLALSILLVGFLVLACVGLGWWAFAAFERFQTIWLLGMDVPAMDKPGPRRAGFWGKVSDLITNPVTWKSLIFLFIKFPLGILSFIVLVTLVGISIVLLIAPFIYWWLPVGVEVTADMAWQIDTLWEALIAFVVGVGFGFASLHILNYLAYVSGLFAQLMLGNRRPETPAATAAPAAAQVMAGAAPAVAAVVISLAEVEPLPSETAPVEVESHPSSKLPEPGEAGEAASEPQPEGGAAATAVTARLNPAMVEPAPGEPAPLDVLSDKGEAPTGNPVEDIS